MTLRSKRRSAVFTLALSGFLFTSLACTDSDERQVDRQVDESVAAARKTRAIPTTQSLNSAIAELSKAVGQTGASTAAKIRAKSILAQTEYEAGQRAARDLFNLRPRVSRAVWDIGQTADQVAAVNGAIRAAEQGDPKPTVAAVDAKLAEMTTAGEAAGRKVAELQGEVDKVKAQIASLTEQKNAAQSAADADAEKATKLADKDAAPVLDQAGESRRKAANLGHEIDKLTASLLPLERDLAAEQAKKTNADEGVTALRTQRSSFESNWQAMTQKIGDQKALRDRLAGELGAKGEALGKLAQEAETLRTQAADLLGKSAGHYAAASKDAADLARELDAWGNDPKFAASPQKKAWEQLKNTYNLNIFKLQEAQARNALGNLHTAQLAQLQSQEKVLTTAAKQLQDAGVSVPPTLAASLQKQIEATRAAADKEYADAAEKFINVYSAGGTVPKDVKQTAHLSRVFSLYGQYLNGDKAKLDEAKKELAEAMGDERDETLVRSLPSDLRPS